MYTEIYTERREMSYLGTIEIDTRTCTYTNTCIERGRERERYGQRKRAIEREREIQKSVTILSCELLIIWTLAYLVFELFEQSEHPPPPIHSYKLLAHIICNSFVLLACLRVIFPTLPYSPAPRVSKSASPPIAPMFLIGSVFFFVRRLL